jgi:phospholipase/lecithinase/hemolysin
MVRKLLLMTLMICVALFAMGRSANASFSYNKIVFFGDSLTDDGNFYRSVFGLMPKSPPYYQGQFSNGSVWAEDLVKYLKVQHPDLISENDAVGGETTVWHNPLDGFLPYVLSESVDNYFLKSGLEDRSNTLFVIFIGANDYLPGDDNVEGITTDVVQKINDAVERLLARGAKNVVILNLPDMSKTPRGRVSPIMQNLYALTTTHNAKLDDLVAQLQNKYHDANIHVFDTFKLFNQLLNDPVGTNIKYHTHIMNVITSCWSGGYTVNRSKLAGQLRAQNKKGNAVLLQHIMNSPDLATAYVVGEGYANNQTPCSNPDDYFFWDQVHPTAVAHQILSQAIAEFVERV